MLTIAYQPNQRYTKILKENLLSDSVISWKATIDFLRIICKSILFTSPHPCHLSSILWL